jgi:hypothetical protein
MGRLAALYPQVHYWELFNEMDVAGWTDLFGINNGASLVDQGRMYAEMLTVVAPAIRASNPSARILLGGLAAGANWKFVKGIYDGGGSPYFDILNFHDYGPPIAPGLTPGVQNLRNLTSAMGESFKQVWMTETGISGGGLIRAYGTNHSPLGSWLDTQKTDMVTAMVNQFKTNKTTANRLDVLIFYQIEAGVDDPPASDLPAGTNPDDYGYGFLRANGTPQPALLYLDTVTL